MKKIHFFIPKNKIQECFCKKIYNMIMNPFNNKNKYKKIIFFSRNNNYILLNIKTLHLLKF